MKKGQIVHLSIPTKNIQATAKFFGEIFGWKFSPMGDSYWLAEEPGNVCALTQVERIANNGDYAIPYFSVEDIDASIRKALKVGGLLVEPKTKISSDYGYFAIIQDPQGVSFGIWNLHT